MPVFKQGCKTGNKDEEKADIHNNIFALGFTDSLSCHTSQVDGQQDGPGRENVPPTVSKGQVCDHLKNLYVD